MPVKQVHIIFDALADKKLRASAVSHTCPLATKYSFIDVAEELCPWPVLQVSIKTFMLLICLSCNLIW